MSLDITAGDDVAAACPLLRRGTPEELERGAANRLRLTVGLRRKDGTSLVKTRAPLVP